MNGKSYYLLCEIKVRVNSRKLKGLLLLIYVLEEKFIEKRAKTVSDDLVGYSYLAKPKWKLFSNPVEPTMWTTIPGKMKKTSNKN